MTDSPKIALALGGGAARGWAHIGVIRALEAQGIHADLIAGTSVGAVVGAMACAGQLDEFQTWVTSLTRRDVFAHSDFVVGNGGVIEGHRLAERFREDFGLAGFDDLQKPLGVVATALYSGQERWLREGDVVMAVRASMALPGIFTPVRHGGDWLVDGGLVNPVPVSLCHAMGAERVIAVNLSDGLLSRHMPTQESQSQLAKFVAWFERGDHEQTPSVYDVIASSITVMQDRITRSRMAGDPPDLLITPNLAQIGLLELHRGAEAIEEGEQAVARLQPAIDSFKQRL